jgi:hypothetical protein
MALSPFVHPAFLLGFEVGSVAADPAARKARRRVERSLIADHRPDFDHVRRHERMFASRSREMGDGWTSQPWTPGRIDAF